jgi:hypothetical protein
MCELIEKLRALKVMGHGLDVGCTRLTGCSGMSLQQFFLKKEQISHSTRGRFPPGRAHFMSPEVFST